jgi:hypothetical protein
MRAGRDVGVDGLDVNAARKARDEAQSPRTVTSCHLNPPQPDHSSPGTRA